MEAPVILVDFDGYDTSRWQVVGQSRHQEVGEIGQSRIVAYDHEVIKAVILRNDDVEDLVERGEVQRILALQEFGGVVYFASDDPGRRPRSSCGTRDN